MSFLPSCGFSCVMIQKAPVPTPCGLRAVMLTTNYSTEQILFSSPVTSFWKLFCLCLILYTIQSLAKISSLHYVPLNDCQGLNCWLEMSNLTVRPLHSSLWERDKHLVIFSLLCWTTQAEKQFVQICSPLPGGLCPRWDKNYNERKKSPQQLSSPAKPWLPMKNRTHCLVLVQS